MKLLFLGAGATGGYFGARLANAGADVTFLVRPKRAEHLAGAGLIVESPRGNLSVAVKTISKASATDGYDAVVLSCKSYDLPSAIAAVSPAVGDETLVLPLLNGLRHLDDLDAAFGKDRVLGGTCHISVTLTDGGIVRHFSPFDALTLGARTPLQDARCDALQSELAQGGFDVRRANDVIRAMWEKWVLLATLAGMTCLMRANMGEIARSRDGPATISAMLDECCAVAKASGHAPQTAVVAFTRATLSDPGSDMTSSMLRDMQRGGKIEADHIVGDLIERASVTKVPVPLLQAAYVHLQAYQNRISNNGA